MSHPTPTLDAFASRAARALAATALAAAGIVLAAPAAAQDVLAKSEFRLSNENWTLWENQGPAVWVPLTFDGSSGGWIANFGGSAASAFSAPAKFTGDQSAAAGGQLSFRMRDGDSDSFGRDGDVFLYSDTLSMAYLQPIKPGPQWETYLVDLRPGPGWFTEVVATGFVRPSTAQDFRTTLADLNTLLIGSKSNNPDVASALDDVFLYAPIPEPGTFWLMGAGLALALMQRRRFLGARG